MKRISLFFFFLIASLLVVCTYAEADAYASNQAVSLIIEGKQQQPEVPAELKKGRTFVPIRFIAENMGARVHWDKSTSLIEIVKDDVEIYMNLDSQEVIVNGQAFQMDTAPYLVQARTMVPVRFVSEFLGLDVGWQAEKRTVIINKPLTLYVNHQEASQLRGPMKVNDSIYLPILELAKSLLVDVKKSTDQKEYIFTYVDEGSKASVTHSLAASQTITIDGQLMAKMDIAPSLLGAQVWNEAEGHIEVLKEVTYLELSDLAVENGVYSITVPGLKKEDIGYFFLNSPQRLVVDLPMTKLADTFIMEDSYSYASGVVDQVRISQYSSSPMTVRVVFDLNTKSKVQLATAGDKLLITLEAQKPLIFIDPGHGGHDPGAIGSSSREKDVVLAIANKLVKLLEADPELDVMSTRDKDVFLSLTERTDLANKAGANVFLSIHANSSVSSAAHGTETYVHPTADKTLGSIIHKHLVQGTGLYDRGLKQANFSVLRTSQMPAALVEVAFISNPAEQKLLNDAAFQDRVAQALYQAIREYEFGK